MGKRAAAKPKATAKEPASKRARGTAQAVTPWPPPPPAPGCWGRPAFEKPDAAVPLRFMLIDIEDGPAVAPDEAAAGAAELRLYGVTAEGNSVCARLQGTRPYFYAQCGADLKGSENAVCSALNAALRSANKEAVAGVIEVESVRRTPAMGYQQEADMLRMRLVGPRHMNPSLKALESGVRLPGADGAVGLEVQSGTTFEANIPLVLRFLVDADLGGGRWLELPAGSYKEATEDRVSSSQYEVIADGSAVTAIPVDSELGSSVPPVRTLSLQVLVDAEGRLGAVAAALSVQGSPRLHARGVWVLLPGAAAPVPSADWDEVTFEDYDPTAPEPAKVFVSNDEATLLDHFGKTLELLDADILLSHDFSQCVRGLLGPRGIAKGSSALARGLGRRHGPDLKISPKSCEVSGIFGRLMFDLQKQVEKEHRLTDYSLGSLLESFCKGHVPELRESVLAQLRSSRPRAYAQHCLAQAEASLRVFDRLAFLYNFVEMARVTGVPLGFLLERGQAVKVQAQLLREAGRRGFVLPSQRPGTGEDTSFEGATVLEPKCGFYRCPIAVLDFASLYPSIMIAHNLCYSTMLPGGAETRPGAPAHELAPSTASADGLSDRRTAFVQAPVRRGLLPSILEQLLSARKAAKKQLATCAATEEIKKRVLNGRQLALKLSANSVYGFTGAMNGPMPCLELAGAITAYGREMIKATKEKVEAHFCTSRGYSHDAEVVYGDTDSVMVRFGPEDLRMEDACRLSHEAAEVCTAAFAKPVQLEFEKVYRPYLLMAKKRYAGLAWSRADDPAPSMETKGIETVRRDWSDLVRQGLEQTLQLLLRRDGQDGSADAISYVKSLCDDLRQGKVDFRSLVISKSLGRDEYATKLPHVEVAEKMRKRDASCTLTVGDRVAYLVLAGAARTKVSDRAEDPLYALENELPVDAEYYLESQLKQPLIRVFEHICGDTQKAEQALFGGGGGQKVVVAPAAASSSRGLGKFMKARPKCLACGVANAASESDAFCSGCATSGEAKRQELTEVVLARARGLRDQLRELRAQCAQRCAVPSGKFPELPEDAAQQQQQSASKESCDNSNCQVIFRRAKCAKDLSAATASLARLGVTDW